MNRLYEIFKTPSGPPIGKALLNHTIFSPSQTGETVPLNINYDSFGKETFRELFLKWPNSTYKGRPKN
jgi:hypothetical protein